MISNPRPGQPVQVWYNRAVAPRMPLHGRVGRVLARGKGPGPRNHAVEVEGAWYIILAGNLRGSLDPGANPVTLRFRPATRSVGDIAAYFVEVDGRALGIVRRQQEKSWRYCASGRVRTGFRGYYRYWVAERDGREVARAGTRRAVADSLVRFVRGPERTP